MNLLTQNCISISNGREAPKEIKPHCGVPQGSPISPILFNIAINFIYEEICDPQFANLYGYQLYSDLDHICLTGFADDQAITSHNIQSAIRVVSLAQSMFQSVGLDINPKRSQAINISNGKLSEIDLILPDGNKIECINADTRIRYLGCSFNSEIIFNDTIIESLNDNLKKLSVSALLKPDQKLNIINQYLFPALTYSLQSAPINKIPQYAIDGLDVMVRRTVKEIIGLPTRTNDNFFYSPRKLRGMGLLRIKWEVQLQHYAIASKLSAVDDLLLQSQYDFENEMLQVTETLGVQGTNTKDLRRALRDKAFEEWSHCRYQGSGIIHFKTHPANNAFAFDKNSLSSSEWVAAIKLSTNYANLNGVPGNTASSTRCRKCDSETETIAHVTGSCPFNSTRITARHHKVKHHLTKLLGNKFDCFEEVHAIDTEGRHRFSDIIAIDRNSHKAFIIDPTVRYETNDPDQDKNVQIEKESIYAKCIDFYQHKYAPTYKDLEWKVIGLWFGSRGSIGESVINFFRNFSLDINLVKEISNNVLIDSLNIIHNHVYS